MQKIPREYVIRTFRQFNFSVDLHELYITVLRETEFPFRRVTLPNQPTISTELIRRYLADLNINADLFYQKMNGIAPRALSNE